MSKSEKWMHDMFYRHPGVPILCESSIQRHLGKLDYEEAHQSCKQCNEYNKSQSALVVFLFCFVFKFIFQRESEHKQGGAKRDREGEENAKQAPRCQQGTLCGV